MEGVGVFCGLIFLFTELVEVVVGGGFGIGVWVSLRVYLLGTVLRGVSAAWTGWVDEVRDVACGEGSGA